MWWFQELDVVVVDCILMDIHLNAVWRVVSHICRVVLKNIAEGSCLTALLGCEIGEGLFCLISKISVRISQNNELIHFSISLLFISCILALYFFLQVVC